MEHRDVVRLLRGLAGTSLGFLTDKHHMEYSDDVLADCATEAVLRGFSLTGNEWNVIKGRPYFTKAGLQRKVREYPGINGTYDETLALPEILFTKEGKVRGAVITCSATWELKSAKGSLTKTLSDSWRRHDRRGCVHRQGRAETRARRSGETARPRHSGRRHR